MAISASVIVGASDGKAKDSLEDLTSKSVEKLKEIEHIIVIYQENRSFDFLFGGYPGVEGVPEKVFPQRQFSDASDNPYGDGPEYQTLPRPYKDAFYLFGPTIPDFRFPKNLSNTPFLLEPFVSSYAQNFYSSLTGNPVHRFYQNIGQINGGKMDKFVAWASRDWPLQPKVNGLVMAYADSSKSAFARLAGQYVLCDHFFQSMYGGSAANHWVLIAGQPLRWKEGLRDPKMMRSISGLIKLNAQGFPASQEDDGWLNPEGWVVNNPQDSGPEWDWETFLPPPQIQTNPTIGDRLIETGISWKWYAQYLDAIPGANGEETIGKAGIATITEILQMFRDEAFKNGNVVSAAVYEGVMLIPKLLKEFVSSFIKGFYVTSPFHYFKNFQIGSENAKKHLVDLNQFEKDLHNGSLPQVVFIKYFFPFDEHPSESGLYMGQKAVANLVEMVKKSSFWDKSAIIITYDENGGFWDHVPPPNGPGFKNTIDGLKFGPGPRVPCVVISPLAKNGFIDSTLYQTTSIIRMIEMRFGLKPVNEVTENSPPFVGWLRT